jgi:hypothetical protein
MKYAFLTISQTFTSPDVEAWFKKLHDVGADCKAFHFARTQWAEINNYMPKALVIDLDHFEISKQLFAIWCNLLTMIEYSSAVIFVGKAYKEIYLTCLEQFPNASLFTYKIGTDLHPKKMAPNFNFKNQK